MRNIRKVFCNIRLLTLGVLLPLLLAVILLLFAGNRYLQRFEQVVQNTHWINVANDMFIDAPINEGNLPRRMTDLWEYCTNRGVNPFNGQLIRMISSDSPDYLGNFSYYLDCNAST